MRTSHLASPTNVAERVIFILTAEDIRHASRMRGSDFS
jgi:hypothetical protein